jgi:2-iminobutanoate/2-iminopropanoate deaminase
MKQVITTNQAPAPIGPYSQAIRCGSLLFCSGQIPLDAKTGQVVGSDIETQTQKVIENISAVLREAGCGWGSVVKTTIFLKSFNDFPKVNEIYGKQFQKDFPARSTVEVSRLPKDVLVEIEVISALD